LETPLKSVTTGLSDRNRRHTQPKKHEFYIGVVATKSNDLQKRKLFILKKKHFHNDVTIENHAEED